MNACTRCAKPILPTAIICPHCGAAVDTGAASAHAARPVVEEDGPSFPVIKVALALFGVGLLVWWLMPVRFPDIQLAPASANADGYDQCAGKQRCVMVFVAPWCSACKQSVGIIKGMMARCEDSSEVGIKPIVGSGRSVQTMEAMAARFGRGVFLDPAGQVLAASGERSVPQWIVVDDEGMLVKTQAGVITNVEMMFQQLDLPNCSLGS